MTPIIMNRKLIVTQSNDLINASYKMTIDEMRIFGLALTKIDSREEYFNEDIPIYPQEMINNFGLPKQTAHFRLYEAVNNIISRVVTLPEGKKRIRKIPVMHSVTADREMHEESFITVRFREELAPYISQLKEHFTSYDLFNAAQLNTPFSFRLYMWLKQYENLYRYQNNGTTEVIFEIDWMKKNADAIKKYKNYKDFKNRLIQPAVDRINAHTDIEVIWEPIKTGRKVTAIKFNYFNQKDGIEHKPLRPRLIRRPKVEAGSHQEGEWKKANLKLLMEYETKMKKFNPNFKMPKADLRKMIEYSEGGSVVRHEHYKELLAARK